MKRNNIITIIAICLLVYFIVTNKPDTSGDFSKVLYSMSDNQRKYSDKVTDVAVSGVEGKYVGEHQIKGANWSIPNILRHWLGVTI